MAGKFETYADKGGNFRFRLKASNGMKSAAKNAVDAAVVEASA